MAKQTTKVITRRKKFQKVEIPLTRTRIELIGNSPEDINNRTIKLDLTRQLKGKSVEATLKVKVEDDKATAYPIKIKLMPYFIRRMIRKRISYVEDSFETPSQESMIQVKPFLITRKRVSRAVRKTIRNKAKNWLEDYIASKKDHELFNELLSNRLQRSLSLNLKKTYPLSLCEIRVLEIKRPLKPEEVPKITKKKVEETKEQAKEQMIDQLKEIEEEKIKQAEEDIKQTQEKASKKQETSNTTEESNKKEQADTDTKQTKEKPKTTKKKETKPKKETKEKPKTTKKKETKPKKETKEKKEKKEK